MKILFALPTYEPSWAFGGTVTATVNLCRELAAQGQDVTVWTTNCDGRGGVVDMALGQEHELGGVKVRYFPTNFENRKAFFSWDMVCHARTHIGEFDIVDLSMIWQLTGYFIGSAARAQGVPYVVTPHSSLMAHAFWGVGNQKLKRLYWRLFGAGTIHRAANIHYLCGGEERESRPVIDLPHYILPNGVPIQKGRAETIASDRDAIRAQHGVGEDDFLLLSLGRIHPKKQLHLVFEALAQLPEPRTGIKLLIVGNVEDREYHHRLKSLEAKSGISELLVWSNPIPHRDVASYYHAADLLVLTSLIEGVSMAVTEAMAEGLPLLGSAGIANADDLIADGAGVIVDQTPESIAAQIVEMHAEPARLETLRENVRRSVATRYDITMVARQTVERFAELIAIQSGDHG